MGFKSLQDMRIVLALSASLSLGSVVFADESAPPASSEQTSTGTAATSTSGSSPASSTTGSGESKTESAGSSDSGSSSSTTSAGEQKENTDSSAKTGESTTERAGSAEHGSSEHPASARGAEHGSVEHNEHNEHNEQQRRSEDEHKSAATHPANQPVKLFGRIEELCGSSTAKIPLKMQAMTPLRDASLDTKLSGKTAMQSFPIDFRGTWSGELTVYTANWDKSYWEFDRAEADKESSLLKPGTRGRVSVTFYQGSSNKTELQPCEVVFTSTVSAAEQMATMRKMMGNSPMSSMFGNNPMMANMQLPYMYALHLGDLTSGTGVTGNQLQSQLMKNTLKELARGVIEQEVVTRDWDRNATTGKTKTGYSESVLRFTRMSERQLYLQAASVSYRSDGKFQNKVILYGTLDRSSAAASTPNPYGMPGMGAGANPFGGLMPGMGGASPGMGGGAQSLQNQMQRMMKQLGGQ